MIIQGMGGTNGKEHFWVCLWNITVAYYREFEIYFYILSKYRKTQTSKSFIFNSTKMQHIHRWNSYRAGNSLIYVGPSSMHGWRLIFK